MDIRTSVGRQAQCRILMFARRVVRRLAQWQRPGRVGAARAEYGRGGRAGPLDEGQYYAWGDDAGAGAGERLRSLLRRHRGALGRLGILGACGAAYYAAHVEEAPVTRRRRLMALSRDAEAELGAQAAREAAATLGAAVLPAHAAPSVAARRVVARLCVALAADAELAACAPRGGFRVRVVDAPETPNALALPGGDVFVFSGLLSVADTDARLAAVLAHEMAHALARHAAEQLSARRFWSLLVSAARGLVFPDVPALPAHAAAELLVHLPYSRACEAEADALGLRLMAAACYPPEAALELWAAMARFEEQRGGPGVAGRLPAFLSTHPPHGERARRIAELLPAARAIFQASGCADAPFPRRRSAP